MNPSRRSGAVGNSTAGAVRAAKRTAGTVRAAETASLMTFCKAWCREKRGGCHRKQNLFREHASLLSNLQEG
jgi:hypothetical protein